LTSAPEIRSAPATACFLCGSAGLRLHEELADRLFGASGRWSFRRCPRADCALVWLDPKPLSEDLPLAYRNYYTHDGGAGDAPSRGPAKRMWNVLKESVWRLLGIHRERRRLERFLLDRGRGRRLLDVGCGHGHQLAQLARLGWQVEGQDVDPDAALLASTSEGAPVHLGPLETLRLPGESFDAVVMNHVLEHAVDPIALLRECHRLLRPGGVLVSITPNAASWGHDRFGPDWRGLEPPRHIHIFTPRSLLCLAERAGLGQAETWTTAANAESFARGSLAVRDPRNAVGWRPAVGAFLFQVRATARHFQHRDSGEECVLRVQR
jgi:SAM-dependent methyltransferase